MSRGGRHNYSFRVEKSYWLYESGNKNYESDCGNKGQENAVQVEVKKKSNQMNSRSSDRKRQGNNVEKQPKKRIRINAENHYETDCDLKRKGSDIDGPPKKKIRTETVSCRGDTTLPNQTETVVNENKSSVVTSNNYPRIDSSESMNENVDVHQYIRNELFDDIESVGSEYDRDAAFITTLFDDVDDISSDISNVSSENRSSFYPDVMNIFGDTQSEDDDEDRVIITEIFDNVDIDVPKKFGN